MNSKKFRLVLLGVLATLIMIFAAMAILGLSMLSAKSQAMVDLKLKNQTADAQLSNLEGAKKEVQKYSYFKSLASTVIPNDKDQAQAVLEIFQMASQSGISIQSVTFPSSSLGSKSAVPAPGAEGTSATSSPNVISQAQPVTGIPGLYSTQLTITPATGSQVPPNLQVTYPKMLDFLSRIENNRRTAQITQVNIQPVTGSTSQITFSLVLNIFIKP